MSFEINARIEDGVPRLRILDADTRRVRLAWSPCGGCGDDCPEARAIQCLFKELLMLSVLDELKLKWSPLSSHGGSRCGSGL